MNNNITFEEYIENLTKRGFILSIEYREMDNRLWIRVRKDHEFFIRYIDNPGDYLSFKIVVWDTIKDLVNNLEDFKRKSQYLLDEQNLNSDITRLLMEMHSKHPE